MSRNQLVRLLKILLEEELTEKARLLTFGEVQLNSEGLILRFTNGKEFQITVNETGTQITEDYATDIKTIA
ncbi:hypothetical protein [Desulfitobacterium sp. AusDCA]|uniref:hypothetical protein n=1 Tax=Desulfitobacterium sp. AusDCA TaxID=3240383 RepID=UPI003DA72CE3